MNFFKRLFSKGRKRPEVSNGAEHYPFLFSQESSSSENNSEVLDRYETGDYSVEDQPSFGGFGGGDFGGGGASDSWSDSGGGDSDGGGGGGD